MALRRGIKANATETKQETSPERFVRITGFVAMAGLALAILAGMVLLPAWANVQELQYRRDCDKNRRNEALATIGAMDKLIAEAPSDEVLIKRLAWNKIGLAPRDEIIIEDINAAEGSSPGLLGAIHYEDPPPPSGLWFSLARKINSPARKRGLLGIAAVMLVTAMLLLAPPSRHREKSVKD